jgi:solute carrier family 44 (choline transporter-like protein), member 2/4/5
LVLASTFATWYWTMDKSEVPTFILFEAIYKTIRYHLGTVAFGSLLMAICKIIRNVISYIEKFTKKLGLIYILCCLKGLFWCLEKFLKFFNTNIYIVTAINGTSFCSSAKSAFSLLVRNMLRTMALSNVTAFVFFISKLFVSLGMGASFHAYIVYAPGNEHLKDNMQPALFITGFTYLICTIFFSVYGMAVDTIFLSFRKFCCPLFTQRYESKMFPLFSN